MLNAQPDKVLNAQPDKVRIAGLSKFPSVSVPYDSNFCVLADPVAFTILLATALLAKKRIEWLSLRFVIWNA